MKSTRSTVEVVLGIIALFTTTGLLCWKMFGNKESKNNHSVTPVTSEKKSKTEEDNQENKKCNKNNKKKTSENNYKIAKNSFDDPETLFKILCEKIVKNKSFNCPEDFMEQLVRGFGTNAKEQDWFEAFPKSIEEMEDNLKELNLYDKYRLVLAKR